MNAIVPASFGAVSTRFAAQQPVDDLSSGIQSSFGLVGYKGKVWSIRHRGTDTPLMRDDGDGPRGSIEVIVLKASTQVSKIWYENGYVEGSNAAPDCFSNNGITPDPTAVKKQCGSCAVCPHNQWGSRVTPAGKQGKSCSDSKRLAVVPNGDINNDAFGGPMLLRVPAASLQDLAAFGQKMQQMGYPYYSIVTKISFDPAESYPKFAFSAVRPLNDPEAELVLSMRDGHSVTRILSDNEFAAAAPAGQQQEQVFEQQGTQQAQLAAQATTTAQTTQPTETPEQKAMREALAEIERLKAAAAKPVEPVETPEQKAMREALAEIERLKAAAAKPVEPVETPEQKAMREALAEIERLKAAAGQQAQVQQTTQATVAPAVEAVTTEVTAAQTTGFGSVGNGAASTQVTQATQASAAIQAASATASPSEGGFEANLDSLLDELLTT